MSQHSSLRIDPTQAGHRNVLKRHERVQRLVEMEKWSDRTTVLGLPKVKSLKIKIKKIKEAKAEGTAAPAGAPQAGAPAAAAAPEKKKAAGPAPVDEKKPAEKKAPEKK